MRKQRIYLTYPERLDIEKYLQQGLSVRGIAIILMRSVTCIDREVKRNGGRDVYKALDAQNRHEDLLKEKMAGLTFKRTEHRKSTTYATLRDRVTSLEQQLEIILDLLQKERNNA